MKYGIFNCEDFTFLKSEPTSLVPVFTSYENEAATFEDEHYLEVMVEFLATEYGYNQLIITEIQEL